jgi:thymidylate kinase
MLVFIEGTDRTGKSTLAKLLAIHLGCYIEHCSKPKTKDPYVEYVTMLERASLSRNMVFDRGYLGEYVYSNLWRGGCNIHPKEFKALDDIAIRQGAIVIHAYAPPDVILERCIREGEELLKPEQISRCNQLFEEAMAFTTLPVYKYDSTQYTPAQYMAAIRPVVDSLRG